MLIEWIWSLCVWLVTFIIGLFPTLPDASWLTGGVAGAMGTIADKASHLSSWIPFNVATSAIGFVIATLLVAFVIKGIRIVASFFTAGGGSAA